jgi:hypothetical protein
MNRFAKTTLMLVILGNLTGCATKLQPPAGNNALTAGFYMLECDAFHEEGMVQVTAIPAGWHVNVLEGFAGDFELHPGKEKNRLTIKNANIDYNELKRSLKGFAYVHPDNIAKGEVTVWILRTRHHRADRPFLLRPATEGEFARTKRRMIAREEWPFGDIQLPDTESKN